MVGLLNSDTYMVIQEDAYLLTTPSAVNIGDIYLCKDGRIT